MSTTKTKEGRAMGDQKIRLSVKSNVELEETRAKANRRKRRVEKLRAQGVENTLGPKRTVSSLEGQAAVLSEERLSSPANRGQVADAMVALQKQQGNAYVQRVVKRLQAAAENEAREEYLEKTVQDLQQQKGSGHPIEGETQKEMEQSLGYDFGRVRLHTDGMAHKAAEALGAKAFTMGTDIFLSQRHSGNLSSSEGKGLLAHELTHVVQQSQGNLSLPGDKVKMGQPGDIYETEADKVAESAAKITPVQRQPEEEEEELLQGKLDTNALQRQVEKEEEEEEEEVQMKAEDLRLQRQEEEEEELVQTKMDDLLAQRQVEEEEEEEEIQAKRDEGFPPVQLQKVKPEEAKEPPKTTKDPKEILGKVVEAAMKTETGKKVTDKLKKVATSEEGIATLSMLAVPTITAMFAAKMEVPQFLVDIVPKVAKFEVGKNMEIAFQPIYKGKFGEKPKEWGGIVTFTVTNW